MGEELIAWAGKRFLPNGFLMKEGKNGEFLYFVTLKKGTKEFSSSSSSKTWKIFRKRDEAFEEIPPQSLRRLLIKQNLKNSFRKISHLNWRFQYFNKAEKASIKLYI